MADFSREFGYTVTPQQEQTHIYKDRDAVKIRTANTLEQIMEKAGMPYEELFGLSKSMKAYKEWRLAQGAQADDVQRKIVIVHEIDLELRKKNPDKNPDEIGLESLYWAARYSKPRTHSDVIDPSKNFIDITDMELPELSDAEKSTLKETYDKHFNDRLLNIGDPYEYINKQFDREGVTTVEYAPGITDEYNVRSVRHVLTNIDEQYDPPTGRPGYEANARDMRDWIRQPSCKLSEYDKTWFTQLDKQVESARALTAQANETNLSEDILLAQTEWKTVGTTMLERKVHYKSQGIDVNIPRYDTTFGLSPLDAVSRNASNMWRSTVSNLGILNHYRENVFPGLFYKYMEDLIEAHEHPSEKADQESVGRYRESWTDFLSENSYPEDVSPTQNVELFCKAYEAFLRSRGSAIIELVDPALGMQLKIEEEESISRAFPYKKQTKHSQMVQAVYPNVEQELAGQQYDRILASWSITAHAMPHMATEEIRKVWEVTDSLLAPEGVATFYPIGHYGNSEEEIQEILVEYKQSSGSAIEWTFHGSGDPRFREDRVLVLRK